MDDCNPMPIPMETRLTTKSGGVDVDSTLYRQLVGSLIYLITTRPNISFVVGIVSRIMAVPK